MAEKRSRGALVATALVAGALALLAAAGPAAATSARGHRTATRHRTATTVSGWLSAASEFPHRTLILAPSASTTLLPGAFHVAENGTPVARLSVTPVVNASAGAVGLVIAIDRNASMNGPGIAAAMAAARQLASLRRPGQLLGMIAFDSSPQSVLGLTGGAAEIGRSLASTPQLGSGDDPAAAVSAAVAQLSAAHVTLGAVVVISDGAGLTTASARAARAAAAATHTPVITIGLRDAASTAASLQALSRVDPGQFTTAAAGQLASVVTAIQQALDRDYLVSWRSTATAGRPVDVTATVDGLGGSVTSSYQAPAAASGPAGGSPANAPSRVRPGSSNAGTVGTSTVPSLSGATPLSRLPGFASPANHSSATVSPAAPAPSTSPDRASSAPPPPSSSPLPSSVPASSGFWSSKLAALLVAIVTGLLIAISISLALYRPQRRSVRSRIGTFTPLVVEEPDPLRASEKPRGGPLRALQRGSWWPPFVEAVEISRSRHSPLQLVVRAAIGGVLTGVLLGVLSGIPVLGLVPVLAWPFVLRSFVNRAVGKQRAKFTDGLPTYLQDLASAIRVGRSFVGALSAVAESADEPTRGEFERAITNEALGRPLEECLESIARRMESIDMDQVALIAGLNRRSGSNVAESLDRVAEGARERADLRREMKALTAQAKMSSLVLTAMPGVLLVGLSVISPQYAHPLFHTTLGIVAVVGGALMCFAGWKVMKKITNVDAV